MAKNPEDQSVLLRVNREFLQRFDAKVATQKSSRNKTIIRLMERFVSPPRTTAPEAPPGSRLDKKSIGRRTGPKKGAAPEPADDGVGF